MFFKIKDLISSGLSFFVSLADTFDPHPESLAWDILNNKRAKNLAALFAPTERC